MMANADNWELAVDALRPLEAQIDAALAWDDVPAALHAAFAGASRAATLVSEPADSGSARLHGVLVELAPQPLDASADGTLVEKGAYVSLTYQTWSITPAQAERLAGQWSDVAGWLVDSS